MWNIVLVADKTPEGKRRRGLIDHSHTSRKLNSNTITFIATWNFNELEKRYSNLQTKVEELETELFEKNESLAKVTTASRQLFQEYETLKGQYETETGAMHR